MTLEKQILVLTCLVVVLPIVLTAQCPSREDVAPCVCHEWFGDATVTCSRIDDEKLAKVASHLRGIKVVMFIIQYSKLGSIPHDVFKGIKLRSLRIRNSNLIALTDGSEALVGLEDHLTELQIRDCVFTSKWDWSVLRNLKKLNVLHIYNSLHLETIGEDFTKSSPSSVETILFERNNISFVSDHAFESFKNIISFSLTRNNIKDVKRTMLPNPALDLSSFSISWNPIEQLPVDMFTNMPKLRYLFIEGNKILVLEEKTFSLVWEQLDNFWINDNPLHCDCRISWILQKRNPNVLSGECASPAELKGKKLEKLQSEDLACYV